MHNVVNIQPTGFFILVDFLKKQTSPKSAGWLQHNKEQHPSALHPRRLAKIRKVNVRLSLALPIRLRMTRSSLHQPQSCNVETQHQCDPLSEEKVQATNAFCVFGLLLAEARQLNVNSMVFVPRSNPEEPNKTI